MKSNRELIELGAELIAEHYPDIGVHRIDVIQDGGIKTVWKVETSKGFLILKRLRKPLPIVKFTTAAQAYLSAKGALVAAIIPTKENRLYFVHEQHALVLYVWIDGTDLAMDENEEHLEAAMKGIAQFHRDTVGFVPPDDCETYDRMGGWPSRYEKMCAELTEWKAMADLRNSAFCQAYSATAAEMIALARQAMALLKASCYSEWVGTIGPYGYMCHQDYGKGNALQTGAGVYVLDLDNLAYDIPLRDVRKLITKRMDHLERWDGPELRRLIGSYTSVLPLTEDQIRVLYIDLLFPHHYYGYVKNPFKKGEAGEVKKLMESYREEKEKLSLLDELLAID